ncbi:hypothetical protein [Coprococcus sp. RTP31081st1_D2_RTP31081_211007]
MGNRGVLLYVDLGKLEDEPYRLSKIYDTLGQYIDDIRRQRDIIYISKMAESLDISSLDRYRAQLVDEYDRLGTLKKILDEAYDLYKECNEKFEASGQTLCNLYAETPWYETSEGKLAIGIGVLVVTAAVAIVCPAVLGATAAAVTQSVATSALVGSAISGIMNGTASVKAGKSFFDGFASGVEEGAIIGALCGMFGAGTAAMMTGAEMTVGNVFAARVINAVGDATIGTATYIYHENKYDKAITGGDVAKTWAECAITSFVLRSVFEGGKSSSKADGKNRGMSTSKGRVESERSITCEGGSKTNFNNEIPRSGAEWNEYLKGKYGADNVRWNINSVDDIFSDPTRLKGYTVDELQTILGNDWTRGVYGSNGGGWKLMNGDISIFYHPGGGKHGGSYYGISSGATGKIKVVNPETYIPLKGDKATVIYD